MVHQLPRVGIEHQSLKTNIKKIKSYINGYWLLMELLLAEPSSASLAPRLREQINSLISESKIIKHYGRLISSSLVLGE